MQVNLKQTEIERALRMYIASQGISLQGREVEISFTAGRRGSGVSAEMQISEDAEPEVTVQPPRSGILRGVVQSETVAEDVADNDEEEEEADAPVAAGNLFGN